MYPSYSTFVLLLVATPVVRAMVLSWEAGGPALTCINDSFTNTVGLCASCFRKSVKRPKFVHDASHVLLKCDTRVLDAHWQWIIPRARLMVVNIKKRFRNRSRKPTELAQHQSSPRCQTCQKEVSITLLGARNLLYVFYWRYFVFTNLMCSQRRSVRRRISVADANPRANDRQTIPLSSGCHCCESTMSTMRHR